MKCAVCNGTQWEDVDHVRESKKSMAMCSGCGFISYPAKYQTEDEIKAHYRDSYRPAPQVGNLFTGERKLYYHEHFLRPLIEEWRTAGKKPVVGEIGSAMGMFLHWFRTQIECAHIHGTELTTTFRRVAFHEFGIKLEEEFDFSRKYDLIANYHVLEHQMEPDVWLKRYADALTEGGVIYLGTPVWFREATNFGGHGFDLGYYYHPDHINVWSEEHLEEIIRKAGLRMIVKNNTVYGNTYILSKSVGEHIPPRLFNKQTYLDKAVKIKQCWEYLQTNQTALAIESWSNCPAAWISHYEMNRVHFDRNPEALSEMMRSAVEACPNTSDVLTMVGDIHRRYENWEKAYQFFKLAEQKKPNNPTCLVAMSDAIRQKALRTKDATQKKELLKQSLSIMEQVRQTSMEMAPQAYTWIFHDQALLDMDGE